MTKFLMAAFLLGIMLTLSNTTLSINKKLQQTLQKSSKYYLLISIGFVGGTELAQQGIGELFISGPLSIVLSLTIFFLAASLLSFVPSLDREARIAWSAHQGSVSVGTFAAATAFLTEAGTIVSPISTTWLLLMEIPAIIVAVFLLNRKASFKEVLYDKSVLLLLGATIAGVVTGPYIYETSAFLFHGLLFDLVLSYFLFEMGRKAGSHIHTLKTQGMSMILYGLLISLISGMMGAIASTLVKLDPGDAAMMSILSASASYVLAPVVLGNIVNNTASIAISLSASLGVILPFNLLIGIPFYSWLSRYFAQLETHDGLPVIWLIISIVMLMAIIANIPKGRLKSAFTSFTSRYQSRFAARLVLICQNVIRT